MGLCRSKDCKVTCCQSRRFQKKSVTWSESNHTLAAQVSVPDNLIILKTGLGIYRFFHDFTFNNFSLDTNYHVLYFEKEVIFVIINPNFLPCISLLVSVVTFQSLFCSSFSLKNALIFSSPIIKGFPSF